MHPIIEQETMKARVAELHRQAKRDHMARPASQTAHTRREQPRRNLVPGRTAVLARRVLSGLSALIPSPTR